MKPGADLRVALAALAALLTAEVAASVALVTVPILAPVAAAEIGVDPGSVAIYSALLFIGALPGSLLASGLVARCGPILVTQASLLVIGLALMLTVGASLAAFALCGIAIGLAYGQLSPSASQVLARHAPARHMAVILSVKQTGNTVGGAIAGVAVAAIAVAFGWRAACIAVAATCVAIALALTPAHRRFDDPAGRGERLPLARLSAPLRFVLAHPPLRLLALSGLPYGALQNCLTTFLVVFLAEGLGYPLIQAGTALTASQLAGMVGRIGWGALAGRIGSGTRLLGVLGIGMGASAITTLLLAPGWPLGLVLVPAAGLGATASGWPGVFAAELVRLAPPGAAARAMGGAAFFAFGGSVLGPLAFGAVAAASGSYAVAFTVLGTVALIPAVACLRAR